MLQEQIWNPLQDEIARSDPWMEEDILPVVQSQPNILENLTLR